MNEILDNLKRSRATQIATLLFLLMGAAVSKSMAIVPQVLDPPPSPWTGPNGTCGKPCAMSSQCTAVCTICGSGTCHN